MTNTPFFPAMRARLACLGRGVAQALPALRQCTLSQIETAVGRFVPAAALQPAPSARERPFSLHRTFWCFVWQMLNENTSCREVVRQVQALYALQGNRQLDEGNSGYCQARARLPLDLLEATLADTAGAADKLISPTGFLQGRTVKVCDCTTLTLPDTEENQELYPQPKFQRPGCGFPLMKLMVISSLRSGAVMHTVKGNYYQNEMRLFHAARPSLAPRDIVIYDRAAGHFVGAVQVRAQDADLISRVAVRKIDWRKGRRLGPDDRLVTWTKGRKKPKYLTEAEWDLLPAALAVRVIRVRVSQKGCRTRELTLVTTLLDPKLYPAEEIAQAYVRRWRLEMCLDDLKTTLGLENLRCKSPAMIHRELLVLLIAHNFTRCVMAEAARKHAVPLDRISFTGTLDAFRHFSAALARCCRPHQRRRVWATLLRTLAADLVPLRPHRREPRAVKRRPKPYALLNKPRHQYKETPHRNRWITTLSN
jgi:Transposase DDE domain